MRAEYLFQIDELRSMINLNLSLEMSLRILIQLRRY
jgi:hypothetical protein